MKRWTNKRFAGLKSAYLLMIAVFFLWARAADAKADVTIATSSFLRISADARGASMGGAQGALTNDVYALYWNPAGLSEILFREVGAAYYRAFQDLNYSFLGYAVPVEPYGTLACQVFFLGSGSITSTYENPDGSFAGTGDTFSVYDFGLGISQSRKIKESLSYGVSAKLLAHKIMDEQAFSLAADAGVIYQTIVEELKVGFVLQNVSTRYKFMTQELREPWGLKAAVLYDLPGKPILLAADCNIVRGQPDTLNLGAEYWFLELVAVRAGVKLPPPAGFLSGFSAGLGINWRDLYQLDYSFCPHTELGLSHRFSLIIRF